MNTDTFYAFEHKYFFFKTIAFLGKHLFACANIHIILDIVLVVQFLVFVYFRALGFKSRRQSNGIYQDLHRPLLREEGDGAPAVPESSSTANKITVM